MTPPKAIPSGAHEEVPRVLQALRTAIKLSNRSQRSIEAALGMSSGYLTRILEGRIHLRVGHVLGVCEQIELSPGELFQALFLPEGDCPVGKAIRGLHPPARRGQ
jgi:transcriptional regulator with XRE-family HTH domain